MRYSEHHSDSDPGEADDPTSGPWGVYKTACALCGRRVTVIATVDSMEVTRNAEWVSDPRCGSCKMADRVSPN